MFNSPLDDTDVAFFSTASDNYAPYSATALLSVRQYCPNVALFLIGTKFSPKNHQLLSQYNINVIEIDLSQNFSQGWYQYPRECYYIFAGPELLYQRNYKYSVYLDGDILCLNNPLSNLGEISAVAGVEASSYGHVLSYFDQNIDVMNKLHQIWDEVDVTKRNAMRLHSGVVFFNNSTMQKYELLHFAQSTYNTCLKHNLLCSGDDALFALLQLLLFTSTDLKHLTSSYNFMPCFHGYEATPEQLIFLHFIHEKPWRAHPFTHQDPKHHFYDQYTRQWLAVYQQINPENKNTNKYS